MPQMVCVVSSNIQSVGYETGGPLKGLHVRFKSGATYRYPEAAYSDYLAIRDAKSPGTEFQQRVKAQGLEFEKLADQKEDAHV